MGVYVDVVFVQDWDQEDDAPEWGDRDAMAEYLTQWDFGTETDDAHAGPWSSGTHDDVTEHEVGGLTYWLITNRDMHYAGLTRAPLD